MTDLAPDVRGVLIDERLCGIVRKELRDDGEPELLLAVQCFLENMTAIAVRRKLNDATPVKTLIINKRANIVECALTSCNRQFSSSPQAWTRPQGIVARPSFQSCAAVVSK